MTVETTSLIPEVTVESDSSHQSCVTIGGETDVNAAATLIPNTVYQLRAELLTLAQIFPDH